MDVDETTPPPALERTENLDMSVLKRMVAKLHTNLGHSGPRTLARAVRTAGGSDEAVSVALAYRCPICERLKTPRPSVPAKLPGHRGFNDVVGVDLFKHLVGLCSVV